MIDLTGRVALVTGAGGGLGRAHALALARAGARVIVNDVGGTVDGSGRSAAAARVAEEIVQGGGEAQADTASVTEPDQVAAMVARAHERWGRVDILVNNAGVLRDRSFSKMTSEEFHHVIAVHLTGAFNCTKAVWPGMCERGHGRIVMTTSSSGLYGNFGQTNYGAAKMGLVGMANTLRLEGARYGIRVNCLAPSATTRMTLDLFDDFKRMILGPESVAPAVVALACDDAPNGVILCAGGGHVGRAYITLTGGEFIGAGDDAADQILERLDRISDRSSEFLPAEGIEQSQQETQSASLHCATLARALSD